MFPGLGGGDSRAAHACRIGLQETLIIDQQIPNVNRAIRPENTDIHHPDTNYAAGPDVITGVQLNASSHPHPVPLHVALCWCSFLRRHSHMPQDLSGYSACLQLSSAALKVEDPRDPCVFMAQLRRSWGRHQTTDLLPFWLQF